MATGAKDVKKKCDLCKKAVALRLPRRHPHFKDAGTLQAWSHTQNRFISVCSRCLPYLDANPEESSDTRNYLEGTDPEAHHHHHAQPDDDENVMDPPEEDGGSAENEYTD